MAKRKRPQRFGWSEDESKSLIIEGEPDYEVVELSEEPPRANEGQN